MTNNPILLYISDIHIGNSTPENQNQVINAFLEDVKNIIDKEYISNIFVVIGGDLVWEADKEEQYKEFDELIVKPLSELGISRDRFIFTPGNHDCQQSQISGNSLFHIPAIEQKYDEQKFNDFIRQDKVCESKFSNFRKYIVDSFGIKDFNLLSQSYILNEDWEVFSTNTSLASFGAYQSKRDERFLGIDTRTLTEWTAHSKKKKILLMHHPQSWLMEWAEREINIFIKRYFDVVLVGHTHEQDILCNKNGEDSFIEIKAPQLFTTKKDNTLGYCIIELNDLSIDRIIYRQWSDKRHCFRPGNDFTSADSGIIDFIKNQDGIRNDLYNQSSIKHFQILLKDKLEEQMLLYTSQPRAWIDRFLSPNRVDHCKKIDKNSLITEQQIIENPHNINILAPVQYGLSCYGIHFLNILANKYERYGIYIPKEGLKKSRFEGYINNKLAEYNVSNDKISWIVIDDWIVTKKQSAEYLTTIYKLLPNANILLLSPRLERYFKTNQELSIKEEGFEYLFLTPFNRKDIRSLVSAFNKLKFIDDDEKVLSRIDSDMKDFNMHRTPINTITLLVVFNNNYDERLINRTSVLEKILQMAFENNRVPNYRTILPDIKDCEFVLGDFCKNMILSSIESFDKDFFINTIRNTSKSQGIELDIEYLFDVLLYNNIIVLFDNKYSFRHSFWAYYFGAMEMYRPNSELKRFLFKDNNYIHYPEILEFYSGKDRQCEDAVSFVLDDLRKATKIVHDKVGWSDNVNLFSLLKCEQTEEQKQKLFNRLDETVKKSTLPTEIKDAYKDKNYNVSEPFNQSVRKFMNEYSVNYLMECISISSRVYRNSDYVKVETKRELLSAIFSSWKVMTQIFFALSWPLALNGHAGIEDSDFVLDESFNEYKTLKDKLIGIVIMIPWNVLNFFKNHMYSEKNSMMLINEFNQDHDPIIKFLQAYILVLERPRDWNKSIDKYISELGANSYYIAQLRDIMLSNLNYEDVENGDEIKLKYLIKKASFKLDTGADAKSLKELEKIKIVKE
jgi:predicted MPP superfamily phosphohydrolase